MEIFGKHWRWQAPCPRGAQSTQMVDSSLVCKKGSWAGRETRSGICRLWDPSSSFQWAEDLKAYFLAEGKPWLSKVAMGDWCFCKPQSCRKLLEETARLEERLQPEKKNSWQWSVGGIYLFLIVCLNQWVWIFCGKDSSYSFFFFLCSNKLLNKSLWAFWYILVCLSWYLTQIILTCIYFCLSFFQGGEQSLAFILQTWRDAHSRIDGGRESFILISVYKPKLFFTVPIYEKKQTDVLWPWKIGI